MRRFNLKEQGAASGVQKLRNTMSGKILFNRSWGPHDKNVDKEEEKHVLPPGLVDIPPGLDEPIPIPPQISHRFGDVRASTNFKTKKKKRNSIVITTSQGQLVADVPSSPFDVPESRPPGSTKDKKKVTIASKTLSRFRKFCSTGDWVVRFRFTGIDLSSSKDDMFRFDVIDFVEKKSIYRSQFVRGAPSWNWKFGVFTMKAGSNRVQIAISSFKDKKIVFSRNLIVGTLRRYYRDKSMLELEHVYLPTDVRTIKIEEFSMERVGSPMNLNKKSSVESLKSEESSKHRRRSLGERVVSSVVPRWMSNLASPRNRRRWSKQRNQRKCRGRRLSEVFTRDISTPEKAEKSDFKPSHTNVSVSHFHDLEDFQSKLRESKTKSEYCNHIRHAQRFFSKNVKLSFVSLDSASVMVKEIKRQQIRLNSKLIDEHNKMNDRLMSIEYVCSTLRSTLQDVCMIFHNDDDDDDNDDTHKTNHADRDVPFVMWILQSLGENRVGKQVFDALETMTGIDLVKNLNYMLYDVKGNSSFPKEIAEIRIESDCIEISKIHHMQLCKNQCFDLVLHVRSICRLNLGDMTEFFRVEICYDADRPCRKVFEPQTQSMIELHSEPKIFDLQSYDKKFNELQSLFLQRATGVRNTKMRERRSSFFNFL